MMPPSRGGSPVLRSPVILGGLAAVVIAIAAIIGMGVMSGGGDDSGTNGPAKTTATPKQTKVAGKLMGKAKVTVSVRSDPGNDYQILGVLRRGSEVEIVGKSDDGEWLQIIYPPGSDLRGWVLAESMEIEGDLSALDIATPEQMVEPQPTRERAATEPPPSDTPPPEESPTPETTPLPSPTVAPLPDLVIGGAMVSGNVIIVTITNQGAGPLADAVIDVTIFDVTGSELLYSLTTGPHALQPGGSIDIKTDYSLPSGLSQLLIRVDSAGAIQESDDANNSYSIAISSSAGGGGIQQPQP
ncbi:MAG: SH3 domain-containing protein [Dehalococcoidia bacterium]|nr:SH3 domain-containing protein [Dehalococcoidia bacterium]